NPEHHYRLDHRAQVAMGVAAAKSVFHQPGITGPKNLRGPVTHADLPFTPQVDNQASFWQRVEVHGPQLRKRMDSDLRDLPQHIKLGMLAASTRAMTASQAVYPNPWLRRRPGYVVVVTRRHGGCVI